MRLWISLVFALLSVSHAQTLNGLINGRVVDSHSASIANSTVAVTNINTGVKTSTVTNAEGNYQLTGLIPGSYRIDAEAAGFKHFIRQPVEVRVGDSLSIDIGLEVGALTENVTVMAETPVLESSSASLGKVVDNMRILDLPVPGGSVFYMMQLSPGVANTGSPTNLYGPNEMGPPAANAIGGTRANASEYSIDGNPSTSLGGVTFNPPPEMVQEFRIQTAPYDVSLGRFAGAHINLVMKSGTNAIHGSAVYTNLSRGMMSHDFFTNRFIWDPRTGPITSDKIDKAWPPQRIVQYRGVISGPVVLPKLYDGRNRTFWMFGVHDMERTGATRAFYTVPTAREAQGDFSELLALGSRYQIYDPGTIKALTGGRYSRDPLPGNVIPASRIQPMPKKLIQYYPLPNTVGTADGVNNYTDPDANGNEYKSYMGRLDHSLSDRNRLQGSVTILEQRDYSLQSFHNEAKGNQLYRTQRGISIGDTWTLGPATVLDLRYGLTRYGQLNYPFSLGYDLAKLGFVPSLISQLDSSLTTVPETTITGYTTIGNNTGTDVITTYHNMSGQLSRIWGNHSMRAGSEFRVLQEARYSYGNVSPAFSFTTGYTQGPLDNSPASPMGQGLAAFLFGTASGGGTDRNASVFEQSKYLGYYFQDDWKLTRRLTVSMGLRYELDMPLTERFDRTVSNLDFTKVMPFDAAARTAYTKTPIAEVPAANFRSIGSITYPGIDGKPHGLWNTDKNNFAPRLGIAYSWNNRTVLRAGYGIFYEPAGSDRTLVIQSGFSRRTSFTPTLDNGVRFQVSMENPFPNGILNPDGAATGYKLGLGTSLSFFNPDLHSAYNQRWSFNVQRQLASRLFIEVGYAGNRAVGLPLAQQYDPVPAQYLSTATVRDQARINSLGTAIANPFYGLPEWVGAVGMTGTTVARSQLLRPYPQFTSLTASDNGGYSWYHSMQVRVEKRLAHGFTLDAAYTWSKLMEAVTKLNDTDPFPSRVISSLDRTQILAISGIYQLPLGKGKRWLHEGRWQDLAFGGWQLQTIYQAQSGQPLDFGNIFFNGNVQDIPLSSGKRSVERWFNTSAGFETDSTKQPASNIRTFPLRFNHVRSDGINNWNMSVIKNFRIWERTDLQLRGEAVDAANTPTFAVPNTTPSNSAFGQVTGLRNNGTQRRITFLCKLTW